MKKKFLIFPVLLLVAVLLALAGCTSKFGYYPHADRYIKGNGTALNISEIDVEWMSGSVKIAYAEQSEITFSETVDDGSQLSDDYIMRWLVSRSGLSIKFAKSGARFYEDCPSKTLTLTLPFGTVLHKLEIETVSAGVASFVDAKEANFESVSGELSIFTTANIAPSHLMFETVSGNILYTAQNAMAGRIDAESVSGNIALILPRDASFRAELDSVSGELHIDSAFSATNEGSTIIVDGGTNIVDAKTVSGNLSIISNENAGE